jgi:hypothetical protein
MLFFAAFIFQKAGTIFQEAKKERTYFSAA